MVVSCNSISFFQTRLDKRQIDGTLPKLYQMNTYSWAVLMGIVAITCEFLYRKLAGPWSTHMVLWIPLHFLMGYLVYRVVVSGDTLLGAFVIGNFVTTSLRVTATLFVLHEVVATSTWVALGFMILAQFIRKI